MNCPNCNETDHEPTAKYCHVCGARMGKSELPNENTKERHIGIVVVSVLLLVVFSLIEWVLFEERGIISIVWNVIMFVGFWADWNKFSDKSVRDRIKPYFFMVPMSVTACIVESNLFYVHEWPIIITIFIILILTSVLFKRKKKV